MKTNVKNYIKRNMVFILLVCQPLLDIIAYFQKGSAVSFAGYFRLFLTCAVPIYVFFRIKKRKKFMGILTIIGVFSILHIINGFRVGYISFFQDVKYLLLVIHMPIMLISFIFLYGEKENKRQIAKAYVINFIFITVTVIISYLTGTGNPTYIDYDYGWTGWFLIPNAQSIILVCLVPFTIYFALEKQKKWLFLFVNVDIVFMLILNGTKSAYYSIYLVAFGYIVFLIFDFWLQKKSRFPLFEICVLIGAIIMAQCMYRFSPRGQIDVIYNTARESEQEELDELEEDEEEKMFADDKEEWEKEKIAVYKKYIDKSLVEKFGIERVLKEYGDNPSAITFSDMRLKKRIYAKLVWEECDTWTQMVGFQYPLMQYEGENFDLENDPPAILYYYGYLGAALYLFLFLFIIIRIIKSLILSFRKTVNMFNFAVLCTLLLQIAMLFNSGYLLRRPNVSIYLAAILTLCYQGVSIDQKKRSI